MAAMDSPADLWRAAVAADPARPCVTAYDEPTGGRVELSRATFDNWVSKTANMLVDGLGAQDGDRAVLALPLHWQSLVWLMACWSVGVTAVPAPDGEVPGDGDFLVVGADRLEEALGTGASEVVGTSLHPLGAPLADCPAGVVDYAVEVRGHGDRFSPVPVDPSAPALESDRAYSGAELVAAARERAAAWGLGGDDRVAAIIPRADSLAVLGPDASLFLGALSAGAPLVLTADIGSDTLRTRLDMERVTALVGVPPGSPVLGGGIRSLS